MYIHRILQVISRSRGDLRTLHLRTRTPSSNGYLSKGHCVAFHCEQKSHLYVPVFVDMSFFFACVLICHICNDVRLVTCMRAPCRSGIRLLTRARTVSFQSYSLC